MSTEQYWPQNKVYLYGTCALFSENIDDTVLNADQLGGYIEHFSLFTDDNQIKALKKYENQAMFKVEVLKTKKSSELSVSETLEILKPDSLVDNRHKYKFRITNIDREKFKTDLIKYLKKFSQDELTNDSLPIKPESLEVLMGRLQAFTEKARRKRPKVTLYDIWPNEDYRNTLLNPFWELIFSSELIYDDVKIHSIGQFPLITKQTGSIKDKSLPYAEIEAVNPQWIEAVAQKSATSTMLDSKKDTKPTASINPNKLKVLESSYDSANHILTLAGLPYPIMKQVRRKNETQEAKLMRLLFSVKCFRSGVGISHIYPVTDHKNKREQVKNARALVTAINKKLPEELKGQELIKFDNTKFYIHPQYKKN